MGTMADPQELLRALKALGAIDRMPTPAEHAHMQTSAGGEALWRLERPTGSKRRIFNDVRVHAGHGHTQSLTYRSRATSGEPLLTSANGIER